MAKSDSTTFKSIVQAIPAIAGAYREGLQALESKDAGKVKPQNPRKLSGSVYLDKCLKTTNPHDARWDYVIGYSEKAYFVEVHPANTSNVDEVVKKKKWLDVWLKTNALDLKAMMAGTGYYWIASGKVAILPNSPQARKIAKNKLVLCKELNLD
jgi:hypothetical protein|nr:hypothetical protein [uncultured Prevotella sp.]